MSLSTFFQRFRPGAKSGRAAATADAVPLSSSDVEVARVRARRRLIGMVVLVGAGVLGFPWLFETQPRSMSPDVQVVQSPSMAGEAAVPATAPSSRSAAGRVVVSGIVEAPPAEAPGERQDPAPVAKASAQEDIIETAPKPAVAHALVASKAAAKPADKHEARDAARESGGKDVGKSASKEIVAAKDHAAQKTPAKPVDKPVSKPADKAEKPDKAADKPSARYVVQFGAFADANTAHEARMKVERLGVKTYAQQVDTPAGKRIRVRVGPFADKAEADKAMATIRKAGLAGAVLTL